MKDGEELRDLIAGDDIPLILLLPGSGSGETMISTPAHAAPVAVGQPRGSSEATREMARAVVLARDEQGLSAAQIAKRDGLSVRRVHRLLCVARRESASDGLGRLERRGTTNPKWTVVHRDPGTPCLRKAIRTSRRRVEAVAHGTSLPVVIQPKGGSR